MSEEYNEIYEYNDEQKHAIQYENLKVISGLMCTYGINIDMLIPFYKWSKKIFPKEGIVIETPEKNMVSNRREFSMALDKGLKICPQYKSCIDADCIHFHIDEEHLCKHVSHKDKECPNDECDAIVLRACNKGKRCNVSGCTYRH